MDFIERDRLDGSIDRRHSAGLACHQSIDVHEMTLIKINDTTEKISDAGS